MPVWHATVNGTAYQGSNSWIILSNRITANNRELKPASHASDRTKNAIKLFHPPRFDRADRISALTTAVSAILPNRHFRLRHCVKLWKLQQLLKISEIPTVLYIITLIIKQFHQILHIWIFDQWSKWSDSLFGTKILVNQRLYREQQDGQTQRIENQSSVAMWFVVSSSPSGLSVGQSELSDCYWAMIE